MLLHTMDATSRGVSPWPARVALSLICLIWLQTAVFIVFGRAETMRVAAGIAAVATLAWCFGTAPDSPARRLAPLVLLAAFVAEAALWSSAVTHNLICLR